MRSIPTRISFTILILLFFFNRVFLPGGLQYSMILAPLFLYFLFTKQQVSILSIPIIGLGSYSLVHLFIGIDLFTFSKSFIVFSLVMISTFTFYDFYKKSSQVERLFETLTLINFLFVSIALMCLFFDVNKELFWYLKPFTSNHEIIPRLKLFELEASHYSLAILPLFLYYFWKLINQFSMKSFMLLFSLFLSLVLSFSLGVLSVVLLSISCTILLHLLSFLRIRNMRFFIGISLFIISSFFLYLYFFMPENPLFIRIENLFKGMDTSGRGRTYEALEIAWQVIQKNNVYFGVGLGQFKIVGRETLLQYYQFFNAPEVVRLPNCMAETLVNFGIVGFVIKLGLQIFFFFRLKVYKNIYQLSIFVAIFIYQFTGSYLYNISEYILWILAFIPKFTTFNHKHYFQN